MSTRSRSLLGALFAAVLSLATCACAGAANGAANGAARPSGSGGRARAARACTNLSLLSKWSLARRAWQVVVVPAQEDALGSVTAAVRAGAGGVVLFGSSAPQSLHASIEALDAVAPGGIRPYVMADEEGGGVQRMANLVGNLAWPRTLAQTESPASVRALVTRVARKMSANGVNMDLAPVLDLASGPGPDATHTDGPRSFSDVASVASAYGLAFVAGLEAGGVTPVVKHFPGEGSASANTDLAPAATPPLATLEHADLLPFVAAVHARAPAVMVGNATVPGLTSVPASLSSAVIDGLLRHTLGFHGLVLTDSLSAVAITARHLSVGTASVDAVRAGADMVLFNSSTPDTTGASIVASLVEAVRTHALTVAALTDAAATVLSTKHVRLCD